MNQLDHEKFNKFIFSIDDSIDELRSIFNAEKLSFSFSEVALFEIEKLISRRKIRSDDSHMINVIAQYIGEYMRKNHGGQWQLGSDEEDDFSFNMPCIVGHNTAGNYFNPIEITENYIADPFEGFFEGAIRAEFDFDKIDIHPEE
jgi:hypothetical protein